VLGLAGLTAYFEPRRSYLDTKDLIVICN